MKTLKRVILAINDAGICVLVNDQIRRKDDFKKVIKVRRDTIASLTTQGYISVIDGVIHLRLDAVVMLPVQDQIEWLNVDEKLRDALVMLSDKDRLRWMRKHYSGS